MELRTDLALIGQWIKPNSHVLDLGCGDGTLLAQLHEERQVTGYGLEIDDNKIVHCIEKGVNVIHTDLNQGLSDFTDNSFDYVIMSETLQAIHRPDLLLQEMLRVGREGIIAFPNFGHWECRLSLFFGGRMPVSEALPNPWYNTENIHLCTLYDFEKLCEELGVTILQRAAVDRYHRPRTGMRILPNLFAEIALYRFCRQR
ncbi:methionine biosynthesis protein MetW [Beggiatoa leptomitoformis]|uniref:Methionine biosynthesis protein MetW n=1 Tax=Beggiatoa leptomitoformis TaxID=288004 RepID=A0A2N9YGR8_9GAMM|nr:methionine biosynthesis protein MetW [Beggiatoa leptomitoformis]ALG68014.1 methionine biosynthesis protein MetW [Beggiatoa leptomitoformis]AUI69700.1 methionine biosynthesis protein MetW [Beggiatoa leptomitoformis]